MRALLMTGLLALGIAPASAGSVEYFKAAEVGSSSVTRIGCPKCFEKKRKAEREDTQLPPGTEINEIKVIEGETKLVTTENWLGGNPVTIVRKATDVDIARYGDGAQDAIQMADTPDAAPAKDESVVVAPTPDNTIVPLPPVVADIQGTPAELINTDDTVATTAALPVELDTSGFKLRTE